VVRCAFQPAASLLLCQNDDWRDYIQNSERTDGWTAIIRTCVFDRIPACFSVVRFVRRSSSFSTSTCSQEEVFSLFVSIDHSINCRRTLSAQQPFEFSNLHNQVSLRLIPSSKMKINANFKTFAGLNFDASKYIASPSWGVNRFMLDRIGNEKARATTIVEYQPNSKFPEHEHIGGEEFIVLKGTFKDQFGEFAAGTYVRNPIGSKHSPWVDEDGCIIMVKLLQMAETGEGITSLHIDFEKDKGESTDFGSVLDMYKNDKTGELVQMFRINPGSVFPTDSLAEGGEELFVYDGSLKITGDEYIKWGWMRFPIGVPSDKRKSLAAGEGGACVFRKTGHLNEKAMSMEKIQIDPETETVIA
jgi:quercetin dioxygenase-like cupin family protein